MTKIYTFLSLQEVDLLIQVSPTSLIVWQKMPLSITALVLRLPTFLVFALWLEHHRSSQDSLHSTCQCPASRSFWHMLPLVRCSVGYHTTLDENGQQDPCSYNRELAGLYSTGFQKQSHLPASWSPCRALDGLQHRYKEPPWKGPL